MSNLSHTPLDLIINSFLVTILTFILHLILHYCIIIRSHIFYTLPSALSVRLEATEHSVQLCHFVFVLVSNQNTIRFS